MVCKKCGKTFEGKVYPEDSCQGCYNYFRKGGEIHSLPLPGEIVRDEKGKVVCHICGRAYNRLGSHIRESHSMTIAQYKEKFDLCNNSRTTESSYASTMRKLAYKNKMPERLIVAGQATRIKPGETDKRKGKRVRLQECLDRSKRIRAKGDTV